MRRHCCARTYSAFVTLSPRFRKHMPLGNEHLQPPPSAIQVLGASKAEPGLALRWIPHHMWFWACPFVLGMVDKVMLQHCRARVAIIELITRSTVGHEYRPGIVAENGQAHSFPNGLLHRRHPTYFSALCDSHFNQPGKRCFFPHVACVTWGAGGWGLSRHNPALSVNQ